MAGLTGGLVQCALHPTCPGIVGSQCQVPVSEHGIQILQMAGGRSGRFFRIHAFVHPRSDLQVVQTGCAGHELPHAYGPSATACTWVKAAFNHGQIFQLVGQSFFGKDLLDHGKVGFCPAKPTEQVFAWLAKEKINAGFDQAVHGQWYRARNSRQLGQHHVFQERIACGVHCSKQRLAKGKNVPVA